MYRVFFINHGYFAHDSFPTESDAIAHARRVGFEAAIHRDGKIVASWSILSGVSRR